MTARLEFFYDYVSPYSYLANHAVGLMEDVDIVYRPMFLGGVMQATGNRPPATVPEKGEYLTKDVYRWVAHYGIPFRFNSIFPQRTISALRLAVAAQRADVFEKLHQPLFDAAFVHDLDLSDDSVLRKILEDADLDADGMLQEIANPAIKDELRSTTEEAVGRGVFGAPTFFVGDEMFFGNDRFEFIRASLGRAATGG